MNFHREVWNFVAIRRSPEVIKKVSGGCSGWKMGCLLANHFQIIAVVRQHCFKICRSRRRRWTVIFYKKVASMWFKEAIMSGKVSTVYGVSWGIADWKFLVWKAFYDSWVFRFSILLMKMQDIVPIKLEFSQFWARISVVISTQSLMMFWKFIFNFSSVHLDSSRRNKTSKTIAC